MVYFLKSITFRFLIGKIISKLINVIRWFCDCPQILVMVLVIFVCKMNNVEVIGDLMLINFRDYYNLIVNYVRVCRYYLFHRLLII